MLIFSTMVSVIVEAGLRSFMARERGLRRMLEQLVGDSSRESYLSTLTRNPAMPSGGNAVLSWLRRWIVPRMDTAMTTMQFAEGLAGTHVREAMPAESGERLGDLVKHLARKFENFAAAASEYYGRRAKSIAMPVAIPFAFTVNVDAVRLFQAFVSNEQLTASIIARGERDCSRTGECIR